MVYFSCFNKKFWTSLELANILLETRPKPVGHGYVFSMTVGTIGEWLKLVPFFLMGRTVDPGGGAGSF